MIATEYFYWNFPGGIYGLILTLIVGFAIILISYAYTLRKLPFQARTLLVIIRLIFLVILIICLSNPSKVKEVRVKPETGKEVAVIIDTSSSMMKVGLTGKTRYQEAVQYWKEELSPQNQYKFKLYTFAEKVYPTSEYTSKRQEDLQIHHTMLFDCISEWNKMLMNGSTDGVICLTDGIDTSNTPLQTALDSLEAGNIPHAFIPMTEPLPTQPYIELRKLETATSAKLGTQVPVTAVISIAGIDPDIPVSMMVSSRGENLFTKQIKHPNISSTTFTVNFHLPISTAGCHIFEGKVLVDGKVAKKITWSIQGVKNEKINVLLYQGGLDWGNHFLRGVFNKDENVNFNVKFAPQAFGKFRMAQSLCAPLSEESISNYDLIIIMKMKQEQIKPETVKTLRYFLKKGGAILFMVANTNDAQEYSGAPIESLLPVEFEKVISTEQAHFDIKTKMFLKKMKAYHSRPKIRFQKGRELGLDIPSLQSIKLTKTGKRHPIFRYIKQHIRQSWVPKFQDFALIRKAKPGARVLAIHPTIKNRIIMATQRFGEGRSALLACDSLWRWKLSMKSEQQAFEDFWKNLVNWMVAGSKVNPYWYFNNSLLEPGKPSKLKFIIPGRSNIKYNDLAFFLGDMKEKRDKKITLTSTKRRGEYIATFIPKPNRTYKLVAKNKGKIVSIAYLSSTQSKRNMELLALNPNIETIKELASPYNNIMVDPTEKFDWQNWLSNTVDKEQILKLATPLWHKVWIFLALLILFTTELIVRRIVKLI